MKKIICIICSFCLVLGLVSLVTLAVDQEEVVTFARGEGFITLDPHDNHHLSNMVIDSLIYDRLVELQPDGLLVPGLAKDWELSENQMEITFYLQEGGIFHNGEPLTSEAVKVTIERFRDNPSLVRAAAFGPDQIDKVEIIDNYTCVLHLKTTYGPVWDILALYVHILPPKAFAEQGVALFDHPIGSGPYKFVGHERDISLTLEANKDYWQEDIPRVDRIIYRPIKEASTQIAAILTGEVDIVDMVHPDQAAVLEADPNITVLRGSAWDGLFYQFNVTHPILSDVKVRTAIDLATEREYLVDVMGGGAPAYIWSKPGQIGYSADIKSDYDPEKAREILAETGYTAEELTFSYKVPEGWYPKMSELAVAIQSMMADVGITFKVEVMEGAAFMDARRSADYDIFSTGGSMTDPANATLARIVRDQDKSGYVNEELNELIIAAANTVDIVKRQGLYEQAYEIMIQERAPQLIYYEMETIYAHRNRITGFPFVPFKVANLRTVDTVENPGPVQ